MVTVTDAVLTNRQFFINRWQAEYPAFVRVMQALPPDQLGYRPHVRSRSAAELVWLPLALLQGLIFHWWWRGKP